MTAELRLARWPHLRPGRPAFARPAGFRALPAVRERLISARAACPAGAP